MTESCFVTAANNSWVLPYLTPQLAVCQHRTRRRQDRLDERQPLPVSYGDNKSQTKFVWLFVCWRGGRDLNPRYPFGYTHLAGGRTRPGYATSPCYALCLAEGEGFEPPVTRSATTVFKTAAINHSAIPPRRTVRVYHWRDGLSKLGVGSREYGVGSTE